MEPVISWKHETPITNYFRVRSSFIRENYKLSAVWFVEIKQNWRILKENRSQEMTVW